LTGSFYPRLGPSILDWVLLSLDWVLLSFDWVLLSLDWLTLPICTPTSEKQGNKFEA